MRVLMLAVLCLVLARPVMAQTPSPAAPPASPANSRREQNAPQVVPTPPTLGLTDTQGTMSRVIASPPVPAAYKRLSTEVPRCAVPPKIDGTLNDPAWRTAAHAAGFYPLGTSTPINAADQTEVWFCADKTHLYVAFHCLDSQPGKVRASATQRDTLNDSDDHVGVDVDSQNTRHGLSTFLVSANGTQSETMEGGTASNITWAGDWKGAGHRTPDGYTVEMSVPFALLRYSKGAKSFGLDFFRVVARTSNYQNWPYLPRQGADVAGELLYMHEFTGINPPFFRPRPIVLPYTLVTGGTGNKGRFGADIKYPLTTSITGVAAISPDFQTIEQDVTNINFSYTEKLLTDRRPFFAEGGNFFPDQDLFYSRRIGQFDGGLKVAGKQGGTTLGVLSTVTQGNAGQNDAVLHVSQEYGLLSSATLDYVNDIERGQPSNAVGRLSGIYGWQNGSTPYSVRVRYAPSYVNGRKADSSQSVAFNMRPVGGKVRVQGGYSDIGPNFVSNLGFVPETDLRGTFVNVSQSNNFGKGVLEYYYVSVYGESYQHHTGGFFHNDVAPYAEVGVRNGLHYFVGYDKSNRADVNEDGSPALFHDYSLTPGFSWGNETLYQQGSVSDAFGRQAGQAYNFLSFSQGVLVSRPFSAVLNVSRLKLGRDTSTQSILTGTYRLNATQTVGGRIVNQTGVDQGGGLGTNIYFSFGQQVRSGTDVFLLFGDPNSPKTRGQFTLKVVRPF